MDEENHQPSRQVAIRAFILAAGLRRSQLEALALDSHPPLFASLRAEAQQLEAWLDREALSPHLRPSEHSLLFSPLGTWQSTPDVVGFHASESLGMLLWALGYWDVLPPFDEPFDPERLLHLAELGAPTIDLLWVATLRSRSFLVELRDTAELWMWRAHAESLRRLGIRATGGRSLNDIIQHTAEGARQAGKLRWLLNGDFPALGKPYAALSDAQHLRLQRIAQARSQALAWVCDPSSAWELELAETG